MNNLKAKLKKQGGFTLVEMLIVVAIIAILIAISIPMISTTLERAREAVDDANERSAVSLAYAYYMTTQKAEDKTAFAGAGLTMYYSTSDVGDEKTQNQTKQGQLVSEDEAKGMEAYGQGTAIGDVDEARRDKVIKLTIKDPATGASGAVEDIVTVDWVAAPTA